MRAEATSRLGYCSVCRGVLSFTPLSRHRFACERCRTIHRRSDPGAPIRRGALRYLIYACGAGMTSAAIAAGMAAIGPDHPLMGGKVLWAAWSMAILCAGCVARSAWLALRSVDFERLEPWERREIDRRLCLGMIRSDVVDDLARRGWSIGKIRTALAALEPGR